MELNFITPKQIKDRNFQLLEVGKKVNALREAINKVSGVDPETDILWEDASFSFKKLRDESESLREANVSSTMSNLFRYGVQHFMAL